jgi:hypothetical protein
MELGRAREVIGGIKERRMRLPTPEETEREERFRNLGRRFIALAPEKLAHIPHQDDHGFIAERKIHLEIPESSEGAEDEILLALKLTYTRMGWVGAPDDGIDQLGEIIAEWIDAEDGHSCIEEKLHKGDLHRIPEDAEVAFYRLEQTLAALEPYLNDGQIDSEYLL